MINSGLNNEVINFQKFLEKRKVIKKGEPYTHTAMGNGVTSFPASYNISNEDMVEFFELYYEECFIMKKPIHLTEKHEKISPILIDLDFRFDINIKERQYTETHIQNFISLYFNILSEIIEFDKDDMKRAFVFEKNHPIENKGKIKDGIHIMFPYIKTKPNLQLYIRDIIINNKEMNESIFDGLKVQNKFSDIYDEAVIEKNNWLMYGSSKPDNEPYKLSKIYDFSNGFLVPVVNNYDNIELVSLLSIRNCENECKIKDKMVEIINSFKKEKSKLVVSTKKKIIQNEIEGLEIVRSLVEILSEERADNQQKWMEVGWCLHNIDYRLMDDWISFSKKSSKFVEGECEKLWSKMNDDGLGIGSLYMWAKQDNEQEYKNIIKNSLYTSMVRSLNETHTDVAKTVHEMYKYNYASAGIKHPLWYEFLDNKWKVTESGYSLRKRISNEIVNEYLYLSSYYTKKSSESDLDEGHKNIFMTRAGKLHAVSIKLRKVSYKNDVMKECQEQFFKEDFELNLDSKTHLIGFKNGVYDLKNNIFREGRPEDNVSMCTNINYIDINENDEYVDDIMEFVSQILPDKEQILNKPCNCPCKGKGTCMKANRISEYVLKLFSSFLSGDTGEEKFHIWTGSGGNGKSKIIELFEKCFGDYTCKLPITTLTGKRAAGNAATPEIARTKGKRFVCLQEPGDKEEINVGLMKEMTGGDSIQARGMYKEPIEFKPQFKMVLTCNKLPKIPHDDGGTWRRVRVVEFQSVFTEKPNPEKKNEFKIDKQLDKKLELWKETFMGILLKYHKRYKEEGFCEPPEVSEYTDNYQKQNDIFSEFMEERIIEEISPDNKILLPECYAQFKEWFRKTNEGQKIPPQKELKSNMEKKYGKYKNPKNTPKKACGWVNLKFIVDDDDSDNDPLLD